MKVSLRWPFLMPIEFAAPLEHRCQILPFRRHHSAMPRFVNSTGSLKRSPLDRNLEEQSPQDLVSPRLFRINLFLADTVGSLSKTQDTATLGLVYWWGRKQGNW
jgi:hypothetical protein